MRSIGAEVLDRNGLDVVGRFKVEDLAVKEQFCLQASDDVLCLAKTVLFPFEGEIGNGHALLPQRINDQLRLVGRDDFILESLEDDEGFGEAVQMVDRRARHVEILLLGVGAHEPVEIPRLEFLGVFGECFEIAHRRLNRGGPLGGSYCLRSKKKA